ncbi:MAG: PorT family protein [Muribaculaceae bacterium]|nr:PorT family protein [Muribaculaceae bacterium]
MKKILSVLMLCVAMLGASSAVAQSRWGVVAGANFSNLSFDQNLFTVDKGVGATVGVMGELMMPGIGFGFDASLLYSQKGAKLHMGERPVWGLDGYGKENCMLHYLEIPLHLRFKFKNLNGLENVVMPILFAGPEFSFLLGHSKIDAMKYAGGELGLDVGVGFEILRKVQLSASRCWGLSYALKTKVLDDFSAKNRAWKISVTYLF